MKRKDRMPLIAFSDQADYDTLWSLLNEKTVRIEAAEREFEGTVHFDGGRLRVVNDFSDWDRPHQVVNRVGSSLDAFTDTVTWIEVL